MFWVIWRMNPNYDPDEPVAGVQIIRITDDENVAIEVALEHRAFYTLTPYTLLHHTELKEN